MKALFRFASWWLGITIIGVLAAPAPLFAQKDPFGNKKPPPSKVIPTPSKPTTPRPAGTRTVYVPGKTVYVPGKTITVTKEVKVTPTTGTLTVALTIQGAAVTLEGVTKRGKPVPALTKELAADEISIIFNDLPPGTYRVKATRAGYHDNTKENIDIAANRPDTVDVPLTLVTYNLTVTTGVDSGEIRYRSNGGQQIVAPLQAGRAVLPQLPPAQYELEIIPEGVNYKPKQVSVNVPRDDANANPSDGVQFNVKLDRRPAAEPFSWSSASDWQMPASWRVSNGTISTGGPGLAWPVREEMRNYQNARLTVNARMKNGKGVAFAVRAADEKNYYLIQLTGANASEPYKLRGFIVKEGLATRQFGNTSDLSHLAGLLKPDNYFTLLVIARGNRIGVAIVNTEEGGENLNLGILADANETFSIGGIGLLAQEGEQNQITTFQICALGTGCEIPKDLNWPK